MTKYLSAVVTSPEGGSAPPTICGLNTGQHMFVDSSSSCNKLSFNIGKTNSKFKSWEGVYWKDLFTENLGKNFLILSIVISWLNSSPWNGIN